MTKNEIEEIVANIFKTKAEEVNLEIIQLQDAFELEIKSQIPKKVLELFENQTYKKHFKDSTRFYLGSYSGVKQTTYYYVNNPVPIEDINVTENIIKICDKIRDLERDLHISRKNLFQIFCNLKTAKKIIEAYPELESFIPKPDKCVALIAPRPSEILNYLNIPEKNGK